MVDQSATVLAEKAAAKGAARTPGKKKWLIGGTEYVQDELTFIEKTEFFTLLAEGIELALNKGIRVESMMSAFKGFDVREAGNMSADEAKAATREVWERVQEQDPASFVAEFTALILRIFSSV